MRHWICDCKVCDCFDLRFCRHPEGYITPWSQLQCQDCGALRPDNNYERGVDSKARQQKKRDKIISAQLRARKQ